MKEALVIVMLVLLVAPLLIGVRRVRRVLRQGRSDAPPHSSVAGPRDKAS